MSDDAIRLTIEDGVALLKFHRPEKLNAINRSMAMEASARLSELARDRSVGAVVLTGEGKAFCAGGDVSSMAAAEKPPTMEENVDGLRLAQEFCWLLHTMPKTTIAAVNGYAMGAGLGIALSCDLRISSHQAKFGTAYGKVGLGGDFGITWQLTRLVGSAKAKELFILGDIIEAEEALRIGLINRIVDHAELEERVMAMARRIARGPLVSFRYMKENVNLAVTSDFRSILDREAFTHIRCSQTSDHREGATAFMEKREPKFRGG